MIEPNLEEIGQRHLRALQESFAQTWREVFDSPRACDIFDRAFEGFEPLGITTGENEGGR